MVDYLYIMERRYGETPTVPEPYLNYLGYTHIFEFPSMNYIGKVDNYHSDDWTYKGNDSGESYMSGGNIYQANCYGRNILRLSDQKLLEFSGLATGVPAGLTTTNFRPIGITRKGGNWFVLSGYDDGEYFNEMCKLGEDWEFSSTISLDSATYGEHDGLAVAPSGNFISATKSGHIVEFDDAGVYCNVDEIDTGYQFRGVALLSGYLVTARVWNTGTDVQDHHVYILSYPSLELEQNFDMSPYLNHVDNMVYGTFILK